MFKDFLANVAGTGGETEAKKEGRISGLNEKLR